MPTEYNLKTKTSYEAAFLVICFNGCEYFVNYISILNKNNENIRIIFIKW